MQLGMKAQVISSPDLVGEIWCLSLTDNTCIIRKEREGYGPWISGWIPFQNVRILPAE